VTAQAPVCPVTWYVPMPGQETLRYEVQGYAHETGKPMVLANDIMVIPNAMPFIIRQLIDAAEEKAVWDRPTVARGNEIADDYDFRQCDRVSAQPPHFTGFKVVLENLEALFCLAYSKLVNRHMGIVRGGGWELLRYKAGDFFKEHIDVVHESDTELAQRRLTVLCLDHDECEGGHLVYPRQGIAVHPSGEVFESSDDQDLGEAICLPSPGTVVIHPAGPVFPHEARPVKSGTKYTLVSFFV